jgi:hypothetical protein
MSTSEPAPEPGPVSAVDGLTHESACLEASSAPTSRNNSTAIVPAALLNDTIPSDHNSLAIVEVEEGNETREKTGLPPADGGVAAWTFLAAAFVIEAIM